MSLLNDALRKKSGENRVKKTGYPDRKHIASHKRKVGKISGICGLPFLLGSLVFGTWYFWGSLSAQTDLPISVCNISKDVKANESDLFLDTQKDKKEGVQSESDALKPKPFGETASLEQPDRIDPIEQTAQTTKRRAANELSPPVRKAEKKPPRVKRQTSRMDPVPDGKNRTLVSRQEGIFFQKALRYHRQGKIKQAIKMYQQVLNVEPDHRDALFNLASAYIQQAAYSEAFPLLKKLKSYGSANPDVLVNLAIVDIGMGKSTEAIGLLDLAAKQCEEPKFEIYFHRAAALSRLGRLEEALSSYKAAEALNPKHPNLSFNLAVLYDNLHRYSEAVAYYRTYIQHTENLSRDEKHQIESRIRSLRAYQAASRG